jgi:peroxiredoxin
MSILKQFLTTRVAVVAVIFTALSITSQAGEPRSGQAKLGRPAPPFELRDLHGKTVKLSDFKGKTVVLEWFNPDCPFVKVAHTRALSLKGRGSPLTNKFMVWLAINSAGPGKQGYGTEVNKARGKDFDIDYPILLDPSGAVGKLYGAERTPHMFVIDEQGILVYKGAIDNTRGGDPDDADPPPARNYVDDVLNALAKGKPLPITQTKPWGCSVKYGSKK